MKRKFATIATSLLVMTYLTSIAAAQGFQGAAIKVGGKFDMYTQHFVTRAQAPFTPTPKQESFANILAGKARLILYIDPTNPQAAGEIKEFIAATSNAKKYAPLLILFVQDDAGIQPALDLVTATNFTDQVIIDKEQYFLRRLSAFRPPVYAVVTGLGELRINSISNLDAKLQNGQTLRAAANAANVGSEWPLSQGEKRESILSLRGARPGKYSVERATVGAAPYQTVSSTDALTKPRLVVFWIATCPHCQKEMPKVWDWYTHHKNDLDLVTVTRMDRSTMVNYTQSYINKKGLTGLPIYRGDQRDFQAFRVMGFPSWAMVGVDGTVVDAREGEDTDLANSLSKALKAAKAAK